MPGEMTELERIVASALQNGWVVRPRGNVRVLKKRDKVITVGFGTDGEVIEARVDGINVRSRKLAAVSEALRSLGRN